MKSLIKILFLSVITLTLFCTNSVFAEGSITIPDDYKTEIKLLKGETYTFVLKADNSVGKVQIYSAMNSVAEVEEEYVWINLNEIPITIKAVGKGVTEIYVKSNDCATYDEEILDFNYKIKVSVVDESEINNNTSASDETFVSDSNKREEVEKKAETYNIENDVNDIDVLTPEEEEIYSQTVIIEKNEATKDLALNRTALVVVSGLALIVVVSILIILCLRRRAKKGA